MLAHLDPFTRQAVAHALHRMLTGAYYDVSVVRDCLALAEIEPPARRLAALRLYHTTRYETLPDGFHAALAQHTLALFAPTLLAHNDNPVRSDALAHLRDLATAPAAQA